MKKYIVSLLMAAPLGVMAQASTNRIVQVDSVGNKQYHLQQYVRIKDRIYPVDSIGNVEYHKGSVKLDGFPEVKPKVQKEKK